jgi:hypothetical protein
MATNLAVMLATFRGNSIISFDTTVGVPLKGGKKNPMQGRVIKITLGNLGQIFQNKKESAYVSMVKRKLIKEEKLPTDYEPQPRKWGEHVPNLPLIVHTKDDKIFHYLEVIFLESGISTYFLDGVEIAKDKIEGLEAPTIRDDAQGGLENLVILRTFGLDSIDTIRYAKKSWTGPFTYEPIV